MAGAHGARAGASYNGRFSGARAGSAGNKPRLLMQTAFQLSFAPGRDGPRGAALVERDAVHSCEVEEPLTALTLGRRPQEKPGKEGDRDDAPLDHHDRAREALVAQSRDPVLRLARAVVG